MPDYSDLSYALAGYGKKATPYDARRKYGYGMIQSGMDTSPIQSPWQGAARLAQALVGGWAINQADESEKTADKKRSDALAQAMAEPDPQKRIGLIAAYDPDAGARAAGQLAVEQAKLQQQQANVGQLANFYTQPQGGGAVQSGSLAPLPQGTPAPGGFANNVGNIRASSAAWEGKGPPQNGFETFPTPQAGANAMFKNLGAYVQQNPTMTVAQAIAKWAPPNENNTQAYIQRLSEATGINPGMPLGEVMKDPAVAATLMDGIARIEKGGLPQGFSADTFIQAASPQQPMQGPTQIAQGGGDGMPPAPNPAQVSGPAIVAPPAVPQKMTVQTAPPEVMAPYVQRLRSGFYGYGPDAALKMEADVQREFDRKYEADKLGYEQQGEAFKHARGLQDKDTALGQATPEEMQKLRTARAEGAAIIGALQDYKKEFEKGPGIRSLLGAATPANTSYNNAALLMKGEALYNLGVLSGPDLDIIRRTLPDPSTFAGQNTRVEDMRTAVEKITNLINARISAKEAQLGAAPSSGAAPAATAGPPPPPPGFRPIP